MSAHLKPVSEAESPTPYPLFLALPMQLAFIGTVISFELVVSGRFGPLLPAVALFVGGYFGFSRVSNHHGVVLNHRLIRRGGVISGVGMWLLSIVLYSLVVIQSPEQVDFSVGYLWFFAPIVSLAPGIGGLVMTLCAGELAATLSPDSPVYQMATRGDPFVRDDEPCISCCPID